MNTMSKNSIATTESKTNNTEENTMTNEIITFNYNETQVRTIEIDGEPWFVLKDVCNVLRLNEPHRVAARLDDDERTQSTVIDSLGRKQEMTIISESGLYSVILRSDKPEAKPFRKWVTSEVLPSIRKTGKYVADSANEISNDSTISMLLDEIIKLKNNERELMGTNSQLATLGCNVWNQCETERKILDSDYDKEKKLTERIEELERENEELKANCRVLEQTSERERNLRISAEDKISALIFRRQGLYVNLKVLSDAWTNNNKVLTEWEQREHKNRYKIDYYDAVVNTEGLYTIEETAKLCSSNKFVIGRNQLYDWLMNNGYISAQNKLPYQKYIENGVFRVCLCDRKDEETNNGIGVFVTSEGLKYLFAELGKSANEFKIK